MERLLMTKGELAKENFSKGMNCAQAVTLAFKDELNLPEDVLKKLIIGFGGGFGRQRLTCGAVSGMVAVLGALTSDGQDKLAIYSTVQKACADFIAELGTLSCAELLDGIQVDKSPKPEDRTQEYYKKRPCAEICAIAASITEKYLNNK